MAVKKLARDGTWYYQFDGPGSTREKRNRIRKFGFTTKKEAQDAEAAKRMELQKVENIAVPSLAPATLDLLFDKFFELHCEGNISETTLGRYRDHRAMISPELLQRPPQEITQLDWTSEWRRLEREGGRTRRDKTPRPLGASTVGDVAGTTSSAYGWGCKQGFWKDNPVTHSKRPKVVKQPAATVSDADLNLLLSMERGFWCQPAYLATADALGKRRGELCAIRWSDWRAGRIVITRALKQYKDKETGKRALKFGPTKGRETHTLTVPETLVPILEKHREEQNKQRRALAKDYHDNDLIFCQENGDPLWPNSVSASISFLCRQLGLPKGTSLHSLRHTHASVLLENGVPLTVVSKRLGHANTRITAEIYSHMLRKEDDQAAEAYDQHRRRTKQQRVNKHAEIVQ